MKTIKMRQRRFFAMLMAALLVVGLFPTNAFATTYEEEVNEVQYTTTATPGVVASGLNLYAGDVLKITAQAYTTLSYFKEMNDYSTKFDESNVTVLTVSPQTGKQKTTITVSDMATVNEAASYGLSDDEVAAFKCWKVTYVEMGSGMMSKVYVVPEYYTESSITYFIDAEQGTNASTNPTKYLEGKSAVTIEDAVANDGYEFAGWYTEETYENEFTGFTADTTGDVELFAKFVEAEAPTEAPTEEPTEDPTQTTEDENGSTENEPSDDATPEAPTEDDDTLGKDDTDDVTVDDTTDDTTIEEPVASEAPANEDAADDANDNAGEKTPETGDTAHLAVLYVLTIASLLGLFVAPRLKKRA